MGTESGYYFVSQVDGLIGKPYVLSREQYTKHISQPDHKGCIEFVSLQDMKGSIYFGGQYDKLKEVAELEWDILIIDEAHEGVDTYKTDVAFDHIKRKYTLHLSGTPFKALANNKFEEKAIFNWTYADEQKAKREWDYSQDEENPYENLPQLNLYTYQMSEIIRDKLQKGADFDNDGETEEYAFDLNEFFITNANGSFKYEADVDKFLDALVSQEKFPFSTPELQNELKHTFWLLNRVDSAKALAKKLQKHDVFKEYEVVLAAGDGKIDDDSENKKALDKVRKAIKEHDKTITLSVGQLTTGITVPEWTAVFMLSNVKSPALYMQAAFRAQNPCLFKVGNELFRKENAYVFDFDPARTLDIFEQFANDLSADTSRGGGDSDTRKKHIRELLNFFPVYGEDDDGEMIALDAEKVLSIPRKIHALEVVRHGFMSNFLFQNISNIFSAPQEVVDIAVVKSFGDYQIEQKKTELERQKELEQAQKYNKPEMIEAINQKFDQQKQQNKQEFVEKMQSVVEDVIKEASETIVKVVETDKKQKQKNEIENSIRDHLRGFSRTIPSFLMAYGNEETCLENFDKIIPDEVFKEVTSITLDEFRFLRDGGDYIDAETGDTKHFDGHLFDPIVFNDSVKEFLNLKRKLGNYFDEASKEDIFDYIPPQKTNQIYTPKKMVVEMVDSLLAENPECFDDSNKTFIDLYMKSGLYITEIVKRLYRNEKMKQAFPNDKERLQHIFANQVYGLAPTEIIYRIAIAYILGFSDEIKIEKHMIYRFLGSTI